MAVAVDPTNNKPFYGVYPVSGNGHYQTDINGGNLRSYGGSGGSSASGAAGQSGAAPGGAAKQGGAAPSGGTKNPQAIAQCVSKAGGDPQKIAACTGG